METLADTFMKVMNDQPLSLALCVMNLILLAFLFRIMGVFAKHRTDTMTQIVTWQKELQVIMSNAVSKESLALILNALERDRETYRAMLPTFQPAPPVPPKPALIIPPDEGGVS